MREIKFRAWMTGANTPYMANWETVIDYKNPLFPFDEGVIPMQYTGLKDKNGKEIYEGDIVKRADLLPGNYGAPWPIRNNDYFYQDVFDLQRFLERGDPYEVIGNIWENGDLLK